MTMILGWRSFLLHSTLWFNPFSVSLLSTDLFTLLVGFPLQNITGRIKVEVISVKVDANRLQLICHLSYQQPLCLRSITFWPASLLSRGRELHYSCLVLSVCQHQNFSCWDLSTSTWWHHHFLHLSGPHLFSPNYSFQEYFWTWATVPTYNHLILGNIRKGPMEYQEHWGDDVNNCKKFSIAN